MDFSQALRKVIDGKKISKLEWDDVEIYGLLKDGILQIRLADKEFYTWKVSEGDLLGFDWFVVA